MGILLDPKNRFINIKIYYIEEVKNHGNSVFTFIRNGDELDKWQQKGYVIYDKSVSNAVTTPSSDKVIHVLNTHWTKSTWKDQNYIISRSLKNVTSSDGKTSSELDGIKYRDLKLKLCLKKWDYIDENSGEPVSITAEVIDALDPSIAVELISTFEKVTEPTDDDLKG